MRDRSLLAATALAIAMTLLASCARRAATPPAAPQLAPMEAKPWLVEPAPQLVDPQLAPMDAKPWLLSADPRPAAPAQPAVAVASPPPVKRDLGDGQDHEPLGAAPSSPTIHEDHR